MNNYCKYVIFSPHAHHNTHNFVSKIITYTHDVDMFSSIISR